MKEWRKPELTDLNFRATKGNIGTRGNDQFVDDFTFEELFTGAYNLTPSGVATVKKEYGIK